MHERKSRVRGRPAHSARSTRAGEERAAKTRGCSGFCIRTGFRGRLDEEKLGRLLILIVADPDGNELCIVSREVFDPLALAADDFRLVRY